MHVAIIMDGNGRWAQARGLPRAAGHREGVKAVRRVVEAAPNLGVGVLTLYAFSGDNWQRPQGEVTHLMRIFEQYLRSEKTHCAEQGIRVRVIGRRDRLSLPLRAAVEGAETATAAADRMHLRIAVDYSARWTPSGAAVATDPQASRGEFEQVLREVEHSAAPVPDVDLLIRTGGEQRLSDFLLWECAYAELYFTPKLWPEFQASDLDAALQEFDRRERRYGRIPAAAAS